jgi:hypothetical protein
MRKSSGRPGLDLVRITVGVSAELLAWLEAGRGEESLASYVRTVLEDARTGSMTLAGAHDVPEPVRPVGKPMPERVVKVAVLVPDELSKRALAVLELAKLGPTTVREAAKALGVVPMAVDRAERELSRRGLVRWEHGMMVAV